MYVTREICATGMLYCSRWSFNSNMLNTTQEYIIKEINMNLQPPLAAGESWRKGEKKDFRHGSVVFGTALMH